MDPDGKRLARRKAAAANESLELLRLVKLRLGVLDSQGLESTLDGLIRDLRRVHDAEEGRGGGHLEARKKYKGRSQHLALEHERGVVTLYLDESGKAHPSLDQPIFVVAAYDAKARRLVIVALGGPDGADKTFDLSKLSKCGAKAKCWRTEPKGTSRYQVQPQIPVTDRTLRVVLPPNSVQTFEINAEAAS